MAISDNPTPAGLPAPPTAGPRPRIPVPTSCCRSDFAFPVTAHSVAMYRFPGYKEMIRVLSIGQWGSHRESVIIKQGPGPLGGRTGCGRRRSTACHGWNGHRTEHTRPQRFSIINGNPCLQTSRRRGNPFRRSGRCIAASRQADVSNPFPEYRD